MICDIFVPFGVVVGVVVVVVVVWKVKEYVAVVK